MFADLKIPVGEDRQMDRRIGTQGRSLFRAAAAIMTLFLAGTVLAACGASASANARQSCQFVEQSISEFNLAQQQTNPSLSGEYTKKSLGLLGSALPLAAIAAGSNGEYQALQATLSEISRVPEHLLTSALSRECAQILPSGTKLQVPGGFVPPANVKATS